MTAECPCQCGHALHFRGACSECGCPRAAPDYRAGAEASGQLEGLSRDALGERLAQLHAWNKGIALQLGYTGPPAPGKTREENELRRVCAYCARPFTARRSHAATCSGACRQALALAREYVDESDIPPPSLRRQTFSRDRARATGEGLMSAEDCYEADRRVVLGLARVAC